MNNPKNLLYTKSHEWLKKNDDGTAYVGDRFALSNGGPRLRVALESRWITKGRSAQILYSRSFVVLFLQQNFFIA
jgi:hypothetical protein